MILYVPAKAVIGCSISRRQTHSGSTSDLVESGWSIFNDKAACGMIIG